MQVRWGIGCSGCTQSNRSIDAAVDAPSSSSTRAGGLLCNLHLMKTLTPAITIFVATLIKLPFDAFAWNIPGHMLSGAITYQIIQRENPIVRAKSNCQRDRCHA